MRPKRLIILALAGITLSGATCRASQALGTDRACGSPEYKVARDYAGKEDTPSIAISLHAADVTVGKLLALSCQLRKNYPQASRLLVDIFNDYDAAKWTSPHSVENVPHKGSNLGAYVAYYYLDRDKKKETLTLVVDPRHPCGNDIDIDITNHNAGVASCK